MMPRPVVTTKCTSCDCTLYNGLTLCMKCDSHLMKTQTMTTYKRKYIVLCGGHPIKRNTGQGSPYVWASKRGITDDARSMMPATLFDSTDECRRAVAARLDYISAKHGNAVADNYDPHHIIVVEVPDA